MKNFTLKHLAGICLTGIIVISMTLCTMDIEKADLMKDIPLSSGAHSPINIIGNANLTAFCEGNASQLGTKDKPFIIQGYEINASLGVGLFIEDTDLHLIIRNCKVENNSINLGESPYGISLVNCFQCKYH
jgi:hypothetical protein